MRTACCDVCPLGCNPGLVGCRDVKKLPFFVYAYADSDIIVARGRSGGLALWQNRGADSEWQAQAGVLQVYN